jgi:hypothetical protein
MKRWAIVDGVGDRTMRVARLGVRVGAGAGAVQILSRVSFLTCKTGRPGKHERERLHKLTHAAKMPMATTM